MLCRHNRYVQDFGQVRDATEVARRERIWEEAMARIELDTGWTVAMLSPLKFESALKRQIDLTYFVLRTTAFKTQLAA